MRLNLLIDRAASIAGSEYKAAMAIGVTPQTLCDWKAGRRTCTAEDRVLLADLAGVDPLPEIAEAMQERWQGKPKGDRLRDVFSRRLANVGNLYVSLRRLASLRQAFLSQPVGNA